MTPKSRNLMAVLVLCGGAFAALPALAQEPDAAIDVNGDGFYSFPEMLAVYADMTEEGFRTIDANGDGLIDMEEFAAATEAGLLTPPEG
ncbi:MAG: hypothetical protein GW886_09635 [Rhodobacterales bacterium]|nr:hypothetical protein [Rhodobacterales bacterium]NCT12840.1 hypothetical protein [Rhodobacterales bacterium]